MSAIGDAQTRRVAPESGIYWDPNQVGNGYLLETQGDTFAFYIFAYAQDGEPEFLVASGRVSEGLAGPLFRVSDGAMPGEARLDQTGAELHSVRVGTIALYSQLESPSLPTYGSLFLDLTLDSPPSGKPPQTTYALQRTNFGHGGIGDRSPGTCWPDMRGEWVFVDKSNSGLPAWRFRFTQATAIPSTNLECFRAGDDHALTFRDPAAAAELRCVYSFDRAPDPLDGRRKYAGCELRRDGNADVVFSFHEGDLGVSRMIGSLGPLTEFGSAQEVRATGDILGLRAD